MRKKDDKKTAKLIMGGFVVFLMVFSLLGIFADSSATGITYEGLDFEVDQTRNVYSAEIDGEKVIFYSLPPNVANIPVDEGIPALLENSLQIVYTFDPNKGSLLYIEQAKFDLDLHLPVTGGQAVTVEHEQYANFPIATCVDANDLVPILFFNQSNTTAINLIDNCIILSGAETQFLRMRDRLLYIHYGVLDG